jgi:hypothetical protein
MVASRLRLENTSIFNYIKYEVISPAFSEQIQNEALVFDQSNNLYKTNSTMEPSPTTQGRGWVIFDDNNVNGNIIVDTSQEQTSKVVVNGASNYTVNYLNGYILNPDTVPTSVSYYWDYVSVLTSWPGTEPPPLPFIAMNIDSTKKKGFQLGGGVKNLRTVYFDIFATSSSERDDMSDVIYDAIYNRNITIKDFESGGYLNYDGTFNTNISLPLPSLGTLFFIETGHKNLHFNDDWTDINKFRSVVSGTYESFVDPA